MKVNKKAIYTVTGEVVTIIDILKSHNEAMFEKEASNYVRHCDLKWLVFLD